MMYRKGCWTRSHLRRRLSNLGSIRHRQRFWPGSDVYLAQAVAVVASALLFLLDAQHPTTEWQHSNDWPRETALYTIKPGHMGALRRIILQTCHQKWCQLSEIHLTARFTTAFVFLGGHFLLLLFDRPLFRILFFTFFCFEILVDNHFG